MFVLLVLLFILLPIAEILVIIEVGRAIGAWWTVLVLIVDSLIGAWLLRRQGRSVWTRFQNTLAAGRMPHKEVVDGALVIAGGAFLLTPGFISDAFGLILLIPPTRAVARGIVFKLFTPASMARVAFVRVGRPEAQSETTQPPRHVDQPSPPQLPPPPE